MTAATHALTIDAVPSQEVVARVLTVVRRHNISISRFSAILRRDGWEIELFVVLPKDALGHFFSRVEAIVDVLRVDVWEFPESRAPSHP